MTSNSLLITLKRILQKNSIYMISAKADTRCSVNSIEFVDDDGQTKRLSCLFTSGEHKRKSKDPLILAKELGFNVDDKRKLEDLHRILCRHLALKNISRFEKLATKYQMKIIFNPKYHCELNSIEGLWYSLKCLFDKKLTKAFLLCFDLFLNQENIPFRKIFKINFPTILTKS